MNKKIKILIVGLVLLIGNNVEAVPLTFGDFQSKVQSSEAGERIIDLNDYVETLIFTDNLTVGGNKVFIGTRGTAFAILNGNNSKKAFTINSAKTVQFYDNFTFTKFEAAFDDWYSGVSIHAVSGSTVNFTTGTFNFISNGSDSSEANSLIWINNDATINFSSSAVNFISNNLFFTAAIHADNRSKANFYGSTVNFINNSAGRIIYARNSNITFTASSVNFIDNYSEERGSIYLLNSTLSFINSIVNFTSNTAINGGAISISAAAIHTNSIVFTNSTINFSSNTSLQNGGAIYSYVYGNGGANSISFINSAVNFSSNTSLQNGGAIYSYVEIGASSIAFINSSVNFSNNSSNDKGGAIYLENSTISFINTNASFIGNSGNQAFYAKNSRIKISGDMEFSANTNGDIGLENSDIVFMPESGKTIKFKGEIADKGGRNEILKVGEGDIVFSSATSIHIPNINFTIANGAAHFNASSNTFNELKVSSTGILGISVDWTLPEPLINAFYVDAFNIAGGASLLVKTIGFAAMGTSAPFVYADNEIDNDIFENMEISGGGYDYSLSLDDTKKVGFLTLKGLAPIIAPPSFSISPVFIANTIRASAISDNSPIYSNIKEKVWVSAQASGGNLADEDNKDFGHSNMGAKAGFAFVNTADFSAGVFAGFGSRSYKQGSNKATASDIDFGAYGSLSAAEKVGLAGFVGYSLQAVKVEGGGSKAEFDATVIKFGAKAEYAAGLISPFIGFEGAIVNTDDVNLGGAALEATAYTRFSSQVGAKIAKNVGRLNWFGRAYIDLLLAGGKPEYSVKPDAQVAKSLTIDGTDENAASFGLGAGGALPVSNAVDVFANADIKLGGDFFGYQTNIGAKFKF